MYSKVSVPDITVLTTLSPQSTSHMKGDVPDVTVLTTPPVEKHGKAGKTPVDARAGGHGI